MMRPQPRLPLHVRQSPLPFRTYGWSLCMLLPSSYVMITNEAWRCKGSENRSQTTVVSSAEFPKHMQRNASDPRNYFLNGLKEDCSSCMQRCLIYRIFCDGYGRSKHGGYCLGTWYENKSFQDRCDWRLRYWCSSFIFCEMLYRTITVLGTLHQFYLSSNCAKILVLLYFRKLQCNGYEV